MGRSVALRTCGALIPHPPDLRWSRWGTLVATWDRWKYQKVGSQSRVPGLVCKLRLQTRDSLNCPWRLRGCDNKQTSQQEEHEALEPKSPATGRGLGQRGGCQLSLNARIWSPGDQSPDLACVACPSPPSCSSYTKSYHSPPGANPAAGLAPQTLVLNLPLGRGGGCCRE